MIYSPNKYRETEGIKDSFSINHTVPYAAISLQQMNLWYRYPHVFWNTSCLSINAGADESVEDNKSTEYGRIGVAVTNMQKEGITIANPDINEAQFSFDPDVKNNAIIYALKAINGLGDDACRDIISNRPYTSFDDFCTRMIDTKIIKPTQMLMLIKAGCFLKIDSPNRKDTMEKYIMKYLCKPVDKLTLSQIGNILRFDIIPEDLQIYIRYINFRKYVLDDEGFLEYFIDSNKKPLKVGYHDRYYILNDSSQSFFEEHFSDQSVVKIKNGFYVISEKLFNKEVEKAIQPLKDWFNSEDAIKVYNEALYQEVWDDKASGNEAFWSMQSLTFYDNEHELKDVDEERYGIVDYNILPEEPIAYETYYRTVNGEDKEMKKYTIYRIAGTVANADNLHHVVSLITKYGVVDIKFYEGAYAHYKRQISKPDDKGGNTVVEHSWFRRGTKLLISGYRRDQQFVPRVYSDSVFAHTVCKILSVNPDGTLELQQERTKV